MHVQKQFPVTNTDFLFKDKETNTAFREKLEDNLEDLNYSYTDNFILLKVVNKILIPFKYYFLAFLKLFLILTLEIDIFLTKKLFIKFNFAKKRLKKLENLFLIKYFDAYSLVIEGQIKEGSIDYKGKEKKIKLLNQYLEYIRHETFDK